MDAEDRAEIERLQRGVTGDTAADGPDKATHDALLRVDLKDRARRPPSISAPPPVHLPSTISLPLGALGRSRDRHPHHCTVAPHRGPVTPTRSAPRFPSPGVHCTHSYTLESLCTGRMRLSVAGRPALHEVHMLRGLLSPAECAQLWQQVSPKGDSVRKGSRRTPTATPLGVSTTMGWRQVVTAAAEHDDGWQTKRHAHYATTDFPLWRAAEAAAWVRARIAARVLPALCAVFGLPLGSLALRESFVVRYEPSGQPSLAFHRDRWWRPEGDVA